MGLVFTFLYIVTAYLSPSALFGDLAALHIEVIIVLLAAIFTVPAARGSGALKWLQTWAIGGLCFTIACSIILTGWFGGGVSAVVDTVPALITFFLIPMNCKKPKHLKVLVMLLFLTAAFILTRGLIAEQTPDVNSPYLLMQGAEIEGEERVLIPRIRGAGFLADPNDLGQFFVGLMPCLFFLWAKKKNARNVLLVYIPLLLLVYGVFLTRSRGTMLAMIAIVIFAARRKIGVTFSVVGGAILFVGLTAVGFTGGREVSEAQGEDRIAAWSSGLDMVRAHPLFGVGLGHFTDYYFITAHNTIVVCAAELGMVGLFFWLLFVVANVRNMSQLSKGPEQPALGGNATREENRTPSLRPVPAAFAEPNASLQRSAVLGVRKVWVSARNSALLMSGPAPLARLGYPDAAPGDMGEDRESEEHEVRRLARLMVLSFVGFFFAGWFLSRAFIMPLYVNSGISMAIFLMAVKRGIAPPDSEPSRAAKLSVVLSVALLTVVYLIVRMSHLT